MRFPCCEAESEHRKEMANSQVQEGFREKAVKILECTVCLGTVDVPKTLKCGHSFCKNCVADFLKSKLLKDDVLQAPKDPMHIVCPNCKEESETFSSRAQISWLLLVYVTLQKH